MARCALAMWPLVVQRHTLPWSCNEIQVCHRWITNSSTDGSHVSRLHDQGTVIDDIPSKKPRGRPRKLAQSSAGVGAFMMTLMTTAVAKGRQKGRPSKVKPALTEIEFLTKETDELSKELEVALATVEAVPVSTTGVSPERLGFMKSNDVARDSVQDMSGTWT
ncbi:hypothetical protein FNV43_RR14989 [Rhamnella rubrinervis]|uniref:Uncharacterized protein n=1 Tax=Rhamnella rubrinervis TaxID=2594499 RepID=A0A8K0MGB9_9ROSA|nr:hypothetical protein FNV43_RR14989 [Rhamnella rubrinervis]